MVAISCSKISDLALPGQRNIVEATISQGLCLQQVVHEVRLSVLILNQLVMITDIVSIFYSGH